MSVFNLANAEQHDRVTMARVRLAFNCPVSARRTRWADQLDN
jgi:hypothetical protein